MDNFGGVIVLNCCGMIVSVGLYCRVLVECCWYDWSSLLLMYWILVYNGLWIRFFIRFFLIVLCVVFFVKLNRIMFIIIM